MAAESVSRLEEQLGRVILGKPEVLDDLLVALLSGGHVLDGRRPWCGEDDACQGVGEID